MKRTMISLLLLSGIAFGQEVSPEAIRTTDIQDICHTKTTTIRDVTASQKIMAYKRAGVPYGDRTLCTHGWEVDHRISLELGGTNDDSNLQLQAYCTYDQLQKDAEGKPIYQGLYDAHLKDKEENRLHKDVCSGNIDIVAAQKLIYTWTNQPIVTPEPGSPEDK